MFNHMLRDAEIPAHCLRSWLDIGVGKFIATDLRGIRVHETLPSIIVPTLLRVRQTWTSGILRTLLQDPRIQEHLAGQTVMLMEYPPPRSLRRRRRRLGMPHRLRRTRFEPPQYGLVSEWGSQLYLASWGLGSGSSKQLPTLGPSANVLLQVSVILFEL